MILTLQDCLVHPGVLCPIGGPPSCTHLTTSMMVVAVLVVKTEQGDTIFHVNASTRLSRPWVLKLLLEIMLVTFLNLASQLFGDR